MSYNEGGGFRPLHVGKGSPTGGQFTASASGGDSSSAPTSPWRSALTGAIQQVVTQMRAAPAKKAPAKPAASAFTTLRMGGKHNDPAAVRRLQQLIDQLKLGNVNVSGNFDQATANAVKAAEQKLGMKPTGTATKTLVDRLNAAKALSPCI